MNINLQSALSGVGKIIESTVKSASNGFEALNSRIGQIFEALFANPPPRPYNTEANVRRLVNLFLPLAQNPQETSKFTESKKTLESEETSKKTLESEKTLQEWMERILEGYQI